MYKVVIGLEVHCELLTTSKAFSSSPNTYSKDPNTNINEIDLGFPGILPVINEEAVRKALKTAMALNCENPDEVMFDRKNYFYPDLPKGYQITQMTKPMGRNGYLMIDTDDGDKKVLIHQLHLEEDTASLDHYGNYSLIDYNRSGIPLMEIVTEPVLNSPKEALTFLESLRNIFLYCGVSEAATDKGQMRCDVNVSLMKEDADKLGTKVEIKNINSFNNVKLAIEAEIKRQTEVLESGGVVIQETRRYDEEDNCTYSMRKKVEAIDYKYFVEPNIAPVKLSKKYLEEIRKEIPVLPYERKMSYIEKYGLSRYDATILVKDKATSDFFEKCVAIGADAKEAANWIITTLLGHINKLEITLNDIYMTPELLCELLELLKSKEISSKQAKEVFYKVMNEHKSPKEIVKSSGMTQIKDDEQIRLVVKEVILEQPNAVKEFKAGHDRILDFLVGQVMKKTKGQANPSMASSILKEEMEKC